MLSRFAVRRTPLVAPQLTTMTSQARTFFGKGWDNAAIDTVYKALIRKPEIQDKLRSSYVASLDGRDADALKRLGDIAADKKTQVRLYLAPHLGDPHRLLKAYSLTAYPIFDHAGAPLTVDLDGQHYTAFADPDDDYAKVVLPQLEELTFLAEELLTTLSWERTPAGAAALLESLYRGSEVPDHVFQTPAVIEPIKTTH